MPRNARTEDHVLGATMVLAAPVNKGPEDSVTDCDELLDEVDVPVPTAPAVTPELVGTPGAAVEALGPLLLTTAV